MTPLARRSLVLFTAVVALLVPATAATAAAPSKAEVLSGWTQATAASTAAWNTARLSRLPYASYQFDWTTDYCSYSPDQPLGFDFTLACWHHDFGYRNYKAIGQFPANKARVDTMFYADLKRKCATYSTLIRPACLSLAWTYYSAVHTFGSLSAVSPADLRQAAQIKRESFLSQ